MGEKHAHADGQEDGDDDDEIVYPMHGVEVDEGDGLKGFYPQSAENEACLIGHAPLITFIEP